MLVYTKELVLMIFKNSSFKKKFNAWPALRLNTVPRHNTVGEYKGALPTNACHVARNIVMLILYTTYETRLHIA